MRHVGFIFCAVLVGMMMFVTACDEYGGSAFRVERGEETVVDTVAPLLLDVKTTNGHVNVVGDDEATQITVVATLRAVGDSEEEAEDRLDRIVYSVERLSDRIRVVYDVDAQDNDVRRHASVGFDITVPSTCQVIADTSNGAISLESIIGTAHLETSNGAIDVYDVVGSLFLDTSNGRIDVSRVEGDIEADTSNGEVWIHRTMGHVLAETSNGSVRFEGTLMGTGNRLRTGNGSVTMAVAAEASIAIEATTSLGSISSRLPLVGDTEGREWSATLNAPADVDVSIRTTNGSIRIEEI